jgi:cell division septal protein FtsQ
VAGLDALHRPGLRAVPPGSARGPLRRLHVAVALTFALLAVELTYIVLASPRFAVREVLVRGDADLAREVVKAVSLPPNTNMVSAPLAEVKRQAEAVPAVREARVERSFPARLVLTLERREPVAVIRREEQAMLVDREGIVFALPEEWGWGLPELVASHIESGDVAGDEAAREVALLLRVLRALGNDPGIRPTRLQLGADGTIGILLDSGTRVSMGTREQLAAKVKLLAATLDQIGAERIARIDLAEPEAASWEPVDGVGPFPAG